MDVDLTNVGTSPDTFTEAEVPPALARLIVQTYFQYKDEIEHRNQVRSSCIALERAIAARTPARRKYSNSRDSGR